MLEKHVERVKGKKKKKEKGTEGGLTFTFQQRLTKDNSMFITPAPHHSDWEPLLRYSLVRHLAEDLSHPLLQSVQLLWRTDRVKEDELESEWVSLSNSGRKLVLVFACVKCICEEESFQFLFLRWWWGNLFCLHVFRYNLCNNHSMYSITCCNSI